MSEAAHAPMRPDDRNPVEWRPTLAQERAMAEAEPTAGSASESGVTPALPSLTATMLDNSEYDLERLG